MQCEIIGRFYETMDTIIKKEKKPKDLGFDRLLHRADISFLDAVNKQPFCNATQLAAELQVTRGAVTQWANRLAAMGLVDRATQPGNKKEKRISLTEQGKAALDRRDMIHQAANQQMCAFLRDMKAQELGAISRFLAMASRLDISPFECKHDKHCLTVSEQGE